MNDIFVKKNTEIQNYYYYLNFSGLQREKYLILVLAKFGLDLAGTVYREILG